MTFHGLLTIQQLFPSITKTILQLSLSRQRPRWAKFMATDNGTAISGTARIQRDSR
jgi:hypothetical protein